MFDFEQNFNCDFELIADGDYPMTITEASIERSKNNIDNIYIKATAEIVGDKFKGRLIFVNFNIINSNEKARNIAMAQLKQLLIAIKSPGLKFAKVEDICNEIISKPFVGKVGTTKDKTGQYPDQNIIKSFSPYENKDNLINKYFTL